MKILTQAILLWLLAGPQLLRAQFSYSTANGAATLTNYAGAGGVVTIPALFGSLPVTGIGSRAFASSRVSNVIITNNVKSIGSYAFFRCASLTNVTIGPGVTNIGFAAFYRCANLSVIALDSLNPSYFGMDGVLYNSNQTVLIQCPVSRQGGFTIPNSVTNLAPYAFSRCVNLTDVTIPSSVTRMGSNVFDFCLSLGSVAVPDLVPSISLCSFANCSSLTNLIIGAGVTNIGSYAFVFCTNLTSVVIPNTVASISPDAFDFCTGLTNLVLGAGIRSIGNASFWNCIGLPSLTIPNSVTNIGTNSFWFCIGLTNITIGSGVSKIGAKAFYWCQNLMGFQVDNLNANFSSLDGVLFNKNQTALIQYPNGKPGDYNIPSGVSSILDSAFADSTYLTNVYFPYTVTNIGLSTFDDCDNLAGLYFYGNAPAPSSFTFTDVTNLFIYYLPGTTGWTSQFGGFSTVLWTLPYPLIQDYGSSFGIKTNGFSFNIIWATNVSVVVQACTNLAHPFWQKLQTIPLSGGTAYFSDSQWTNYPSRYYRIR